LLNVARPDALVAGADFFLVHYCDHDLLVPEFQTLRYERRATTEDGRDVWLFREPHSAAEEGDEPDEPIFGFEESQLYQLLDLDGLVAVVNELRAVCSRTTRPSGVTISIDRVLNEHGVREHVDGLFASSALGTLHMRLRYTDDGLFLERTSTGFEVHLYAHPLLKPDENARLSVIMNEAGLTAQTDYLADKGRTRILHYRVPAEPATVAALCAKILAIGYEMRADDKVQFSLSEDSGGA
jgi:hypothetical protein